MKHNNSFIFNYQITETRPFKVNLEDLATILIEDNVVKGKIEPPIPAIIKDFGDNIDFYLYKFGLPEGVEIDEYDYLYDSVYDDLETILEEKLQN